MTERALPVTILEPAGTDPELLDHSLSLRFDLGQFDDRIDFTRNSTATYFGSDGLLKTASANEPRIDYNPVTGECKGFLVEEVRTNLLQRSEGFGSAPWGATRATVAENAAVAPDGTMTARKLTEDASANSTHLVVQNFNANASTTYTYSVFVKRAERNRALIQIGNFANQVAANAVNINLDTGSYTATDPGRSQVLNLGGGWFRVSTTITTIASPVVIAPSVYVTNSDISSSYTGDGVSGIYVWGAQLEVGSFPTSYIKTESTAATRAADSSVMTGTNFSSWYRQDEGTMFAEWVGGLDTVFINIFSLGGATGTINIRRGSLGNTNAYVIDGAVSQSGLIAVSGAPSPGTAYKVASAYKANNFAVATNGSAATEDTAGTVPNTIANLVIGNGWDGVAAVPAGAEYLNSHIKRLAYYPRRLTNDQLVAVTQ